ncbi:SLOG family protein [Nonomuraea sp. NPDC050310]|uniref:SLOG family protein n=1 Tax=Nonomuraea sp. NPDC050310 TaxID=3154935 RepID=UPI00340B6E4C
MPKPYRILVTGSRTWSDEKTIDQALREAIPEPTSPLAEVVVVHGDCPTGADALANEWCVENAWWMEHVGMTLIVESHPAEWNRYGKAAGFRRNAEMVALGADICLAFISRCNGRFCQRTPHGSHGATHTADLAEKAGIRVIRYPRRGHV